MHDEARFRGVVDIGITFNSTSIHSSGLIGAVFGGDTGQSATTVKLATRLHLGEDEEGSTG